MTDRHADTTGTQPDDDAYVAALTAEGDVARLARERDEARAEAARCREALERITARYVGGASAGELADIAFEALRGESE